MLVSGPNKHIVMNVQSTVSQLVHVSSARRCMVIKPCSLLIVLSMSTWHIAVVNK